MTKYLGIQDVMTDTLLVSHYGEDLSDCGNWTMPCRTVRRAVANGGGVGGVTPPLKTSCRQMKGFVGKRKIKYHKTLS
jgi:hypothetical protein